MAHLSWKKWKEILNQAFIKESSSKLSAIEAIIKNLSAVNSVAKNKASLAKQKLQLLSEITETNFEFLKEFFDFEDYVTKIINNKTNTFWDLSNELIETIKLFNKHVNKNKQIISVGAGEGLLESILIKMGFKALAYDITVPNFAYTKIQKINKGTSVFPQDCKNVILMAICPQDFIKSYLKDFQAKKGKQFFILTANEFDLTYIKSLNIDTSYELPRCHPTDNQISQLCLINFPEEHLAAQKEITETSSIYNESDSDESSDVEIVNQTSPSATQHTPSTRTTSPKKLSGDEIIFFTDLKTDEKKSELQDQQKNVTPPSKSSKQPLGPTFFAAKEKNTDVELDFDSFKKKTLPEQIKIIKAKINQKRKEGKNLYYYREFEVVFDKAENLSYTKGDLNTPIGYYKDNLYRFLERFAKDFGFAQSNKSFDMKP